MDFTTWLIFGCSPSITKIADRIPDLCRKYPSIGLNVFPTAFPDITYWIFNDAGLFPHIHRSGYIKKHHKLIIGKDRESELKTIWFKENQCLIQREYIVRPHYVFDYEYEKPVLEECGKLLIGYSIVIPAINYALLQGAKEVVLIGIDLDPDWNHFYGSAGSKPEDQIRAIKEKIKLFDPYIKLYKDGLSAKECKV